MRNELKAAIGVGVGLLIALGGLSILGGGSPGTAIAAMIFLSVGLAFYFVPMGVASSRNTKNFGAVAIINLFLGWTFIGWVVALAMAAGGEPAELQAPTVPGAPATRLCPYCAETIKYAANVCRFCQRDLPPPSPPPYVRGPNDHLAGI